MSVALSTTFTPPCPKWPILSFGSVLLGIIRLVSQNLSFSSYEIAPLTFLLSSPLVGSRSTKLDIVEGASQPKRSGSEPAPIEPKQDCQRM